MNKITSGISALWFVGVVLLMPAVSGFGQNMDSLRREAANSNGRPKIELLLELAEALRIEDPEKSIDYSRKALQIARELNDTTLIAKALLNTGHGLRYQQAYQAALDSLYLTVPYLKKLNASLQTRIMNLTGMLHQDLGHDTMQAKSFIRYVKSRSDSGFLQKNIRIVRHLIHYYDNKMNYRKALAYAIKLALFEQVAGNTADIVHTLNLIAGYHNKLENYGQAMHYARMAKIRLKKIKARDSLRAAVEKSIGVALLRQDSTHRTVKALKAAYGYAVYSEEERLIIEISVQLGNALMQAQQYKQALERYNKAQSLAQPQQQNALFADIQHCRAKALLQLKHYIRANKALQQARKHAPENDFELKAAICKTFSELYQKQGKPKQGIAYMKLYSQWKDSLFQKNKQNALEKLRTQNEWDKKEQRIKLLKMDSRINSLKLQRRKARIIYLTVGIAMLIAFVTVVGFWYRSKLKANKLLKEQNRQINQQNEELQMINKQLAETEKYLQKSNATREKFLSIIAHDVKEPLNALRSLIYSLKQRRNASPEQIKHFLEELDSYALNTLNLLNNLLLWARSRYKEIRPEYEQLNLPDLVNEVIDSQKDSIQRKALQVRLNTPAEKALVSTDRNMATFVVRNLLTNAIKFTNKQGVIDISIHAENDTALLRISDNGIGMDKQTRKKLTNNTLEKPEHGTAQEKGAGLGLSLCFYFIDKLGESLTLDSKPGQGTTAEVTFRKA